MKLSRRISSALLSITLCLSLLPTVPALAEEESSETAEVPVISEAPETVKTIEPSEAPEPSPTPEPSDFVVEGGVLIRYTGPGGEVVIPDNVETIAVGAFWNRKDEITAVVIPDSVTTIEWNKGHAGTFSLCGKLERVELGSGLTEIPWETFALCSSLKEIEIPANVKIIGSQAFEGCSNLTSVTIYGTDTQISQERLASSFHNCSEEMTVYFPDRTSAEEIPTISIDHSYSARIVLGDGTVPTDFTIRDGMVTKYTGPGGRVIIPRYVTEIGAYAFGSVSSSLTEIVIPDGVTSIGAGAFEGCTGLKNVTIPDRVTTIGRAAFPSGVSVVDRKGNSLAGLVIQDGDLVGYTGPGGDITIPGSFVKRITRDAFHGFYSTPTCDITSLTVTSGVTEIGKEAFYWCNSLTRVTLADTVTTIGEKAFAYCENLQKADLGKGVKTVEAEAFLRCPALTEVSLPASAYVDGTAFLYSPNVEGTEDNRSFNENMFIMDGTTLIRYAGPGGHVVIPDGVTEIGMYDNGMQETADHYSGAFQGCSSITGVTIPNSVTTIAPRAFSGCTGLTRITIPDSVTRIGTDVYTSSWEPLFSGCENLKTIVFGDGLKELPQIFSLPALERVTLPAHLTTLSGFYGCSALTRLEIPSSVTTIEQPCNDCGVTALVIPEGVRSCGGFYSSNFRELTLPSTLESRPDLRCPELRKLTLPTDCWAFKGISRADFMKYIQDCPKLEEIVNCPNEFVGDLIASNAALRDNWTNPQSTITPQSARITKLSNEITAGLTSDYDKAKAISQWVVDHIKYDYDYYYEGLKDYSDVPFDPEDILDKGQAVCAGISRLTQALMVAQRIPCLYVLGSAGGPHAWNLALIDGEYLWMDNTWGMEYFGLGIYAISRDHTATGAAAFNNVKGPGTLVSGSVQKTDTPWTAASASAWAQAEVEAAISAQLVPEALQNRFTDLITRQEFCTLMVKLVEQKSGQDIDTYLSAKSLTASNPFTDTADNNVLAAYALGIVKGTSATTFDPSGSITRQEAATMLERTGKLLGLSSGSGQDFADKAQFGSWAEAGIGYVSGLTDPDTGKRVMEGTGSGNFSPLATYSREQAILTALRLFRCAQ